MKKTTAKKNAPKSTPKKAAVRKAARPVAKPKAKAPAGVKKPSRKVGVPDMAKAAPKMTRANMDDATKAVLAANTRENAKLVRESTIGLRLVTRRFNNERKADLAQTKHDGTDSKMLALTKTLLDSPELKAIAAFDLGCQIWLASSGLPSYLMASLYRIPIAKVRTIFDELKTKETQRKELVAKFLDRYEELTKEAAALLGPQWKASDYPPVAEVERKFRFEFFFMEIDSVPDTLSTIDAAIYDEAVKNTEKKLSQVVDDIRLGLTESFQEIIDHMASRLASGDDGKPKIFRDSLINNLTEFFAEYPLRNVTGRFELDALVEKAKKVVAGVDPDMLRNDLDLRARVAANIQQIKAAVDSSVVTRTRAISFSSEDL